MMGRTAILDADKVYSLYQQAERDVGKVIEFLHTRGIVNPYSVDGRFSRGGIYKALRRSEQYQAQAGQADRSRRKMRNLRVPRKCL